MEEREESGLAAPRNSLQRKSYGIAEAVHREETEREERERGRRGGRELKLKCSTR